MPDAGVADDDLDGRRLVARLSRRGARRAVIVDRPPTGVWRRAFATRLPMTSRIRTGSTSRSGSVVVDVRPRARRPAVVRGGRERRRDVRAEDVEVGRLAMERQRAGLADRASVRRSSTSRLRTRVSSRIAPRWASSAGWTPSRIASTLPWIDGQRRPQLVGHVGEQAPPLGLVGLEAGGHRVEAAGEVADRCRCRSRPARPARRSRRPRRGRPARRGRRGRAPDPPDRRGRPDEARDDGDRDDDGGDPDDVRRTGPGAPRIPPTTLVAMDEQARGRRATNRNPNRQPNPRHGRRRPAAAATARPSGHHGGRCGSRGRPGRSAHAPRRPLDARVTGARRRTGSRRRRRSGRRPAGGDRARASGGGS